MKRLCKTIDSVLNNLAYVRLKSFYETGRDFEFIKTEHRAFLEYIEKRDAKMVSELLYNSLSEHYAHHEKARSGG